MRGIAKLAAVLFGAIALMTQAGGSAQADSREHTFAAAHATQIAHQYQRQYHRYAQPKAFHWNKHAYKRAHKHWRAQKHWHKKAYKHRHKHARRHWNPRRHDHRYMQFHGRGPQVSGHIRHLKNAYEHGFAFDRRGHFKRRSGNHRFFGSHRRKW